MKRIAIFASGSGTNADKLMAHFTNQPDIEVSALVCNVEGAGAFDYAAKHGVEPMLVSKKQLNNGDSVTQSLLNQGIDYIVLAGVLLKVPDHMVHGFKDRIINIHPALLPLYGGKGMYGMNVHNAVVKDGRKESGITIHLVNEVYDDGRILFQASCEVTPDDSPSDVQKKVQVLEHQYFPQVVENYIRNGG